MSETNNKHSLISLPGSSLTNTAGEAKRVLSVMMEDALALGREAVIAQPAKFRIGEHSWCEPDYRQILLWAEALKMEPLTVIEKLIAGEESEEVATRFYDGRMLSLSWNLDELPLLEFRGVEGLTVEKLRTYTRRKELRSEIHVTVHLPSLGLWVSDNVPSCEIFDGTESLQRLRKGFQWAWASIKNVDEMRAAGWITILNS